jgi:hypothetical protein
MENKTRKGFVGEAVHCTISFSGMVWQCKNSVKLTNSIKSKYIEKRDL